MADDKPMYCSFCGRSDSEVALMIAAPAQAWICDNCVQICMDMIFKNLRQDRAAATPGSPLPQPGSQP
jgi:ATP-dependent Clp protease ATP-binding subunit ClpX